MLQNLFTGLIPPLGSLCLVALQIVYRGSAPFGPFLLKLNLDSSALQGGVDAPVRKMCEATEAAQTGWSTTTHVFGMHSPNLVCERPPRPLHQRSLRGFFLMSRPPLLTEEGNTAY